MATFHVRLYDPGSPEAVECSACVNENGVVVADQFTFPFDDIEMEVSGANKDRVKVKSTSSGILLVSSDIGLKEEITRIVNAQKYAAQKAVQNAENRARLQKQAIYWTKAIAVVLGFASIIYLAADPVIDMFAANLDPNQQTKIGQFATSNMKIETGTPAASRVSRIGQQLLDQLDQNPYKFAFLLRKEQTIDASAYPGGIIVVNQGLAKKASDDELGAVIGHEIGVVLNKDTLRPAVRSLGVLPTLALLFGMQGQPTEHGAEIAALDERMKNLRLNREQEVAADTIGARLAVKTGFRGDALMSFFHKLRTEAKTDEHLEPQSVPFFASHPLTSERVARLKEELNKLQAEESANGTTGTTTDQQETQTR